MKTIQNEWSNLTRIISMIAEQFGSRCEVVLHDLTKDYNHTIVAIENGHVTQRVVGGSGSNLGLQVLSGKKQDGDEYNYITHTKDGKILRSSTSFLRDENGAVVGALCVNYDIGDLIQAEQLIQELVMHPASQKDVEQEIFASNVGEILDHLTAQCNAYIGKPVDEMSKEDKISAIEFFDSKGAFLITKAGEHIREYLNISKFTLYNYLEISRNRTKGSAEQSQES